MRIRGWHVDGFGVFHDARVEDLPSGLTIVAGPNEAGKSTLLAFLRGVLFGFPDGRSRSRRHPPVNGGRHGGAVVLGTDDGDWSVERYVDPKAFVLRRPDGSLAEDHELTDLLGHADAGLFNNVFAFGLSELDGFELLDSQAVRDRVFSAGVVGAGRSARSAIDALDARRSALVRPRGRCVVRDLADEARATARTLVQAQAAAADLVRRRDDVDRLADLAESRRRAVEACRTEQHRLRALLEAWPWRGRIDAIEQELDELEEQPGLDDAVVARFDEVRAELAAAEVALDAAELALAAAVERRDELDVDDRLVELGPVAQAVGAEIVAEDARTERLSELDREIDVERGQLDELLGRLGTGWDRAHLDAFDVSIPAADDVRRRGRELDDLVADHRRLVASCDDLRRRRDEAEAEVRDIEARLGERDLDGERERQERRARSLRQLRAHLVDLGTEAARLDAAERAVTGLRAVRPPARSASGAVLGTGLTAVGVALVLFGLAAAIGGSGQLATVLGGSGVVLAALGLSVVLTRRTAVRPDGADDLASQVRAAEAERDAARVRVDHLRASVRAAALVLDLPEEPSALDVEDCAAALDAQAEEVRRDATLADRLVALVAERDGAAAALAPLELEASTREAEVEQASRAWAAWKEAQRLPPDLGVEAINDLFTAVERARSSSRRLHALEREREHLDEESNRFRARAVDLLRRAGLDDDGDDLLADVRHLVDRAAADRDARRALEERTRAVDDAEQRTELAYDRVALARAERTELLERIGAIDDAGVRTAVERWRRRRELVAERAQAEAQIHAVLGRGDAADAAAARLVEGDVSGWEAALEEEVQRMPDLEAAHEDAIRMHHDAARSLEELSRTGDVAEAAVAAASARTRLAEAVGEWQTLTAARQLVAATLGRYERERQPAVLARAEAMFRDVTDGAHQGLAVVDGELEVLDRRGRRLSVDDLSRGTAEQLYLCMRFGLAAEMAAHTPLPFVMDDVLVNFDPERTERMAAVVADLAGAHQVLVFTCQPTTVAALEAASPGARVIELPRHGVAD
ncbi:AAA family ATPase [Actinomarinicola tropica]|uniref:AAA family ATPase n=1 Tax=Actinomarinicola tropica TaxID=2789776 RepID=UPI00189C0B29|nr:AAA family ATPase [Actinomarinicola tropica]